MAARRNHRRQMDQPCALTVRTLSAAQTRAVGHALGRVLRAGDFVALVGPLGSGKTCFTQGLAAGLGITQTVCSPTFIIMRLHPGEPPLCHVDMYRLEGEDALEQIGLLDMIDDCVTALEWAENARHSWPNGAFEVRIEPDGAERVITIASTRANRARLDRLQQELER